MRNCTTSFLVAVALFASSGCEAPLTSGTVASKEFIPAHDTQSTHFIMAGKTLIPITNTVHHPDEWRISIVDMVDDKVKSRDVSVTRFEYDTIKYGERYEVDD